MRKMTVGIIAASFLGERFRDTAQEQMDANVVVNGKELLINKGSMLTRVIYHYWYHNGKM